MSYTATGLSLILKLQSPRDPAGTLLTTNPLIQHPADDNYKTDKLGLDSPYISQEPAAKGRAPVLSELQHSNHPGIVFVSFQPGDTQGAQIPPILSQKIYPLRPDVQGPGLKRRASPVVPVPAINIGSNEMRLKNE